MVKLFFYSSLFVSLISSAFSGGYFTNGISEVQTNFEEAKADITGQLWSRASSACEERGRDAYPVLELMTYESRTNGRGKLGVYAQADFNCKPRQYNPWM
jgi:hypothetical protein